MREAVMRLMKTHFYAEGNFEPIVIVRVNSWIALVSLDNR
jgi:hypothetical protein